MIVKNAAILTMDSENPFIQKGTIVVNGNRIERVVEQWDGAAAQGEEVIDGEGMLAMPGLINTHTHGAMTFLRNYGSDMNLQDWLYKKIFPAEKKLTAEACYWFHLLADVEMIQGGITSYVDGYFYMDSAAEAVGKSGMRAVLSRSLAGAEDPEGRQLQEAEDFIVQYDGAFGGRVRCIFAPHAIYTCPEMYLRRVISKANRYKCGFWMHIAETKKEVEDCRAEHGTTPVQYLDHLGLFDIPGVKIAAHCVHVAPEDLKILKNKNVSVSCNLSSNLKLASGIPDIPAMLREGLCVTLGTDGASSNNNLNLFQEMRTASLLYKGLSGDPLALPAAQVLKLATVNGAQTIGQPDLGMIKQGCKADFILINLNSPSVVPVNDVSSAVVYSVQGKDVDTVVCDGRILMQHREIPHLDVQEIVENVKRLRQEIFRL